MEKLEQLLKKNRLHGTAPSERKSVDHLQTSFGGVNSGLQIGQNRGNMQIFIHGPDTEVPENQACLRALHATNPRLDKERIERIKGGLLEDAYTWVLDNVDFNRWLDNEASNLLWVKGDPGKGKTMLLCGVLNELAKKTSKPETTVVFFFCSASYSRINHPAAVLRGLIFMFVDQHPVLICHVRREYDRAGAKVFEDANAWETLLQIFTNILQDPLLDKVYLVIDALDECTTDLGLLLDFIVEKSSLCPQVKWLVSSRNWPSIEQIIETAPRKERLWLELNEAAVSEAVASFVSYKVQILTKKKNFSDSTREFVSQFLLENAHGTFLWVALVCEEINKFDVPRRAVPKKLRDFPAGLDQLYQRMLRQISVVEDADLCKTILGICSLVFRPITLDELGSYIEFPANIERSDLEEIIGLCGSFLTLRQSKISFVHQSAKDFLRREAEQEIFPNGESNVHRGLFSKSLSAMNKALRRDIYNLAHPGYPIDRVEQPDPDPLASIRYACLYWVDHLLMRPPDVYLDVAEAFQEAGSVDEFFRKSFLHWLESMSLLRALPDGVNSLLKFNTWTKNAFQTRKELIDRVQDAYRFVLHSQNGIKDWPLQVYAGALIFSPERSITRLQYQSEAPSWIVNQPKVEYHWSSCLQTLEHGQNVRSVCFSCDSKLVASSSSRDIRLWDSGSGNCLSTFRAKSLAKSAWIDSISFSCNSRLMAVISDESGMKVWDITDGKCVARLGDLDEEVDYAMFLQHTDFIACKSSDERVSLWTDNNGEYLRHLAGHSRPAIRDFALSRCLGYFASGSHDGTIKVWDIKSGNCIHTIKSYKEMICSITFSPDSVMFASCSLSPGGEIKLWKPSDWGCSMILQHGHKYWVNSLTFSHDSKILASGSHDNTIKLWDTDSGDCFQTLHGHQSSINSLVFSHESQLLGSASNDGTVKIWDAQSREQPRQFDSHGCSSHLHFSHDLSLLASVAIVDIRYPGEVKIWDVRSGNCIQSLEGSKDRTCNLIFSNDLKLFAEGLNNDIIRIWDIRSATCLQEFTGSRDPKKFFLANPGLRLFDGTLASCSFSSYGPNSDTHGPYRRPVAYSISRDKRCITYKSECLLWLPPEYRLSPLGHSVQTESTMCIGCSSGRVVMFTFDSVVLSEILPVVKPGKMGGHVDGASAEI